MNHPFSIFFVCHDLLLFRLFSKYKTKQIIVHVYKYVSVSFIILCKRPAFEAMNIVQFILLTVPSWYVC